MQPMGAVPDMHDMTDSSSPLVSIVVPTYNYGRFIGEMLESVLAQTYQNWECIIVDDGSDDGTDVIVARFAETDTRIKYFRQENRGQPAALNTGLKNFAGKYLQILDADDLIEPQKLERQVESLEKRPEVDIVYSRALFFRETEIGRVYEGGWPLSTGPSGKGREILPQLLRANIMTVNAPLVRRSAIESIGFFDEELSPVQDWDYWLRCALGELSFHFEDQEGIRALVRMHQMSMTQNRARTYKGILLTRKKVVGLTSDVELLKLNYEIAAADEGYLGVEEAVKGNLFIGVRGILRAAARERKPRWRAKWILCALAAPFVPGDRLRGMITTSLQDSTFGLRRKTNSRHG